MRRLLIVVLALGLPAAATAAVRAQTITGSITANSGSSLTVSSTDRSLTCRVNGSKAQAAIARWGLGVRAAMACAQHGDDLVLTRLSRLGVKEATTPPPATTTTTTTAPPEQPAAGRRDARGKVTAAGGGSITVLRPDGSTLVCSLTEAQQRSVLEGAPAGSYVLMVCAGTGDRPALVSLQRIDVSSTTPTPPAPVASDKRQAIGIVTELSSDAVTVKPGTGEALRCRITAATDSQGAAAKLSLGASVGIVCRRDGDSYVLAGATSAA